MTRSTTEFTEIPGLDGVSVVRHCGDSPTEARHMHDSLCVGAVLSGRRELLLDGERHAAGPGDVLVIPPGAAHACPCAGECEYIMVSIPVGLLERFGLAVEHGTERVVDDPALFGIVRTVADTATFPASRLERQATLLGLLSRLCVEEPRAEQDRPEPDAVAIARHCLETRFSEDLPLGELARLAGCSPCRLNRVFASVVGMPPHQYQTLQRVRRVKECIRHGLGLAESAAEAGFADQSHMSRCFRKVMGMTPGKFAKGLLPRLSG
jgi:AraC-like DNA-binding protein